MSLNKKTILFALSTLLIFPGLFLPVSAFAYTINLQPEDTMILYQDGFVLGQMVNAQNSGETMRANTQVKTTTSTQLKAGDTTVRLPTTNSRIQLESTGSATKVRVEQKLTGNERAQQSMLEKIQRIQNDAKEEGRDLTLQERNQIQTMEQQAQKMEYKVLQDDTKQEEVRVQLKNNVQVRSLDGKFEIEDGEVRAQTSFPLRIDAQSGVMTVVTPAGEREVSVLPQQAVTNLMERGILSRVETNREESVTLRADGQGATYRILGSKSKRLFGLFPIDIQKEIDVSLETGEVVSTQVSTLNSLLDALAL